jgi:subtilisin-like proprotein convertase family protein
MIKHLLLFASLLFISSLNSFAAEPNKGYSKIQSDYNSGKIGIDNQLLQKFYYGFDKSKLAPEYRDDDLTPLKCGTEMVMEYHAHEAELQKSTIDQINSYLKNPFEKTATTYTYLSHSGKFLLTYDIDGVNAVPLADTNGNGIPDYIEWIAGYFDYVWHFEIDSLGYLAPPITTIGTGQYQVGFENMSDYGYTDIVKGQLTHIVLHNNFIGFPSDTDPEGTQKGAAKVTAAHEFKHATQIMYNHWNEPSWFLEMDATWMEDIAYNYVNDYYNYLPSSQIVDPGVSFDRSQGYEDCIWMHYLSQKFGIPVNKQIWIRRNSNPFETMYTNFDNILSQYSYSFLKGYKEYFTWNYSCGSNHNPLIRSYTEASNYPTSGVCQSGSFPDSSTGCGFSERSANYIFYQGINSNKLAQIKYYGTSGIDQSLELIFLYKNNTAEIKDTTVPSNGALDYISSGKLSDIKSVIAIPIITSSLSGSYNYSIAGLPFNSALFTFTPLKDFESTTQRAVLVNLVTENNIALADSFKLYYKVGNWLYPPIKMLADGTLNEYTADIPGFPLGAKVSYYFSVYDTLGQYYFLPSSAPAVPFTYNVVLDTVPPVIIHSPITQKTKFDFPFSIFADVNDNMGIDSVYIDYSFNGSNFTRSPLTNYKDSTYYIRISPDSQVVNSMSLMTYRITALDISTNKNKATYPLSGFQQINIAAGYQFISAPNKIIKANVLGGIRDTINVPNDLNIGNIKIIFNATYPRFSDLTARLTPPFGTAGYIFKNPGLGTSFENAANPQIELEQDAFLSMNNFQVVGNGNISGEYQPDTLNLNNYINNNARGTWILTLVDTKTDLTGILLDWGLIITPSTGTDVKNTLSQPTGYKLAQNYPNPFNPSTRISYSIPTGSIVKLSVFDILGREIAVLVNEFKSTGNYEVEFSTSGKSFPSGVYFYKLEAGNFTSVKKLVLLK